MKTPQLIREPVDQIDDWELICIVAHWSYEIKNLTTFWKKHLYQAVWAESDGYGMKGYIPCQGYDWSGIRDSSEQAKKQMAKAARDKLSQMGVLELEYAKKS